MFAFRDPGPTEDQEKVMRQQQSSANEERLQRLFQRSEPEGRTRMRRVGLRIDEFGNRNPTPEEWKLLEHYAQKEAITSDTPVLRMRREDTPEDRKREISRLRLSSAQIQAMLGLEDPIIQRETMLEAPQIQRANIDVPSRIINSNVRVSQGVATISGGNLGGGANVPYGPPTQPASSIIYDTGMGPAGTANILSYMMQKDALDAQRKLDSIKREQGDHVDPDVIYRRSREDIAYRQAILKYELDKGVAYEMARMQNEYDDTAKRVIKSRSEKHVKTSHGEAVLLPMGMLMN